MKTSPSTPSPPAAKASAVIPVITAAYAITMPICSAAEAVS